MQFEVYVTSRSAAGPLSGDEIFVFVQGGISVRGTLNEIVAFIVDSIGTGGEWGTIMGTITDQTDLVAYVAAQITAAVVGLWDDRGNFNASVNAYPSSGGSGTAGAILKGDVWTVSVAGTLPTAQSVSPGDTVRALVDTPGNTQANWAINAASAGSTVPDASESTKGKIEIADQTETNTGSDDTRAITPLKLKNRDGAVATLSDSSTTDITSDKWTWASSATTRTTTFSFTGDKSEGILTLSNTTCTLTFPAACLCVSEGTATGNNVFVIAGTSGDKYYISIRKFGSAYYVVCRNFGQ